MLTPYPEPYEIFPAIPGLPVTDLNRFATRRVSGSRTGSGIEFSYGALVSDRPCLLIGLVCEVLWALSGGTRYVLLCDAEALDGRVYVGRYALNLSLGSAGYTKEYAPVPAQGWLFQRGLVLVASDDPWSSAVQTSGTKFIHLAELLS